MATQPGRTATISIAAGLAIGALGAVVGVPLAPVGNLVAAAGLTVAAVQVPFAKSDTGRSL